jgi:endonuclease-3
VIVATEVIVILRRLQKEYPSWQAPVISFIAQNGGSPFKILISTILSLRTKDQTTMAASQRLYALAPNLEALDRLDAKTIESLIYPVGFYRTKSANIKKICRILLEEYKGSVPADLDLLLALPGVGRKTANLVITLGFGIPGVCVDTHVHRISNRWDFVNTETPEQTEMAIRKKLPEKHWIRYNDVLVAFGQTICKPVSPLCSSCPVEDLCVKRFVQKHR